MIFSVSGALQQLLDNSIIVDVNGVGYQVYIPETVIPTLPAIGEAVTVFTYHHIREDNQTLFGFLTMQDRDFFMLLTSVSGVGPKVGIAILSGISVSQFVDAVLTEKLTVLTSVPGVGKKMAERLVVELKDKLAKLYKTQDWAQLQDTAGSAVVVDHQLQQDLTMAMKTLGYSNDEVKRAIKSASDQLSSELSLEAGVKVLLKHL